MRKMVSYGNIKRGQLIFYLVILILSLIRYWPIPNKLNSSFFELLFLFMPIICLVILIFYSLWRKSISGLLVILIAITLFVGQSKIRDIANEYIVYVNRTRSISEHFNPILGTTISKGQDHVSYNWRLAPGDYESLIFKVDHGLKNYCDGREIRIVINENWYVSRNVGY